MRQEKQAGTLAGNDSSPEERRQAAAMMGRARTPAKVEAARRNGLLAIGKGGRPIKPLFLIECRCEAGEAMDGHRWDCPRGQAIKRRRKAGTL